jgi:hypothetical protein
VEQPTQEVSRVCLHDLPLPGLEDDRSLVLAARAVLGEQARPVLPRHGGHDAARYPSGVRAATRCDATHEIADMSIEVDVGLVVVDVEVQDATSAV